MELNYDFKAKISVDGVPRELATIWEHSQDDPYPGGHRRIELRCKGRSRLLWRAVQPSVGIEFQARQIKDKLVLQRHHFAITKRSDSPPEWEFVLNTIDKIESSKDVLRISSECSPFVRQ